MKNTLLALQACVNELKSLGGLTTFQKVIVAIVAKIIEIDLLQDDRIAALEKK